MVVSEEEVAVQRALGEVKSRHLDARDKLVKAAGEHAAAALSAVREAEANAAEADKAAEERWRGHLDASSSRAAGALRTEAAASELEGRLRAARVEVEASAERVDQLRSELQRAIALANEREKEVSETRSTSFHNHCLLVKLLLNTKRRPENVLSDELFSEMSDKGVPLKEWPNWVMTRMSGGDPLSKWL